MGSFQVSGEFPFDIEFRIERGPNGIFQGGPGLTFNATIDGNGVCSIGGALADGVPVNGFAFVADTEYSIVVAISNFSGTPLPEEVVVNVSNVSFSYCEPAAAQVCSLMAGECMDCSDGFEITAIDFAVAGGNPFSNTTPAVYDFANNTGTLTLPVGGNNVFSGVDAGNFEIPADVNDICITADIDLISGDLPLNIEFRLERGPNGIFQGGPGLTFNGTIDGNGVCSVGGSLSDGTVVNGFTLDASTEYSVVVAVSNFSGTPLATEVVLDVSNISFSFCAPIAPCTLASAVCETCETCEESFTIDLTTGDAFNFAPQDPQPTYDSGTNMGTLSLPAGNVNTFTVAGVANLSLPDYVNDICLTADLDIISGESPFVLEFRLENGTGAPSEGGQALTFDVVVDGAGMCSMGGGLSDGVPVNGFTFVPGANYVIVVAIGN